MKKLLILLVCFGALNCVADKAKFEVANEYDYKVSLKKLFKLGFLDHDVTTVTSWKEIKKQGLIKPYYFYDKDQEKQLLHQEIEMIIQRYKSTPSGGYPMILKHYSLNKDSLSVHDLILIKRMSRIMIQFSFKKEIDSKNKKK